VQKRIAGVRVVGVMVIQAATREQEVSRCRASNQVGTGRQAGVVGWEENAPARRANGGIKARGRGNGERKSTRAKRRGRQKSV
jgi:hypothetical protein